MVTSIYTSNAHNLTPDAFGASAKKPQTAPKNNRILREQNCNAAVMVIMKCVAIKLRVRPQCAKLF